MNAQKMNPAVISKRRERDIMKLLMSDYKVTQSKENPVDFIVDFPGPKNTIYEEGVWQVHVLLPDQYPYKSPSIGFNNKMFHPNVDEGSGSVCLDVINQSWSPMYDLVNVFDTFLPQLLSYPNPTDPLNPEAAALMIKDEKKYEKKVKEFIKKHALPAGLKDKMEEILPEKRERKESHQVFAENHENISEDDVISNISLDDVSELSELSNLDIPEACY